MRFPPIIGVGDAQGFVIGECSLMRVECGNTHDDIDARINIGEQDRTNSRGEGHSVSLRCGRLLKARRALRFDSGGRKRSARARSYASRRFRTFRSLRALRSNRAGFRD